MDGIPGQFEVGVMIGICMNPFVFLIGNVKAARKPDKSVAYDDLAVSPQIDEGFHQLGNVRFMENANSTPACIRG